MLSIITAIIPVIDKILSKYITSKEEKEKLKQEITVSLLENEQELKRIQADIVKEEIQGSWLQRNWRPLLMLCFVLIIFNNYILVPYLSIFTDKVRVLEFPNEFWNLLLIGVGGYIAGRTLEKVKGVSL